MATYPNVRRNKLTDTLYRANDVKPLDGDVLVDDGSDGKLDQKFAELKKMLVRAPQERKNQVPEAEKAVTGLRTPARDPLNEALIQRNGPMPVPMNRKPQIEANLQRGVDQLRNQLENPRDQGSTPPLVPAGRVPGEVRSNKEFVQPPASPTLDRLAPMEPVPPKPTNNDQTYLARLGITGNDKYKPLPMPLPITLPDNLRKPPIAATSVPIYGPSVVDPNKSIEMNRSLSNDTRQAVSDTTVDKDPTAVEPRRRIAADPTITVPAVSANANPVRRDMPDEVPPSWSPEKKPVVPPIAPELAAKYEEVPETPAAPAAAPTEEQRAMARVEQKFKMSGSQPEQLAPVADAPPAPGTVDDKRAAEIRRGFQEDRARVDAVANAPRLPTFIPEGMQPDPKPLDTARAKQEQFDRIVADPNATPQQIAEARRQMDQSRNDASGYRTYGFRSSETPEQSAEINRQLAAARQPLDAGGSLNTGAEQDKWDRLRGSMGNDELARADRDAEFMKQVKSGPQSQEETYWRINQQREAAGLPPVAMPSAQDTEELRRRAEANKTSVANANQTAGLARQQQNADAEKNYNAQRAAQGESRRLGIPPAAAAMFDPTAQPGTAAYDANMGVINPAVGLENARNSGSALGRQEDRKDREAAANMHIQAWQAEKKRLQDRWDRSPPEERVRIEQQMRDGEAAAYSRAMNAMMPPSPVAAPGAAGAASPMAAPPAAAPPSSAPPAAPMPAPPSVSSSGRELPNIVPTTTNSPSEFAANAANYRPNFAALHSASGWNHEALQDTFKNVYRPSAGPYEDTNGDGFPSFGDKGISNNEDLQYYQGVHHSKRMLDDLMSEIPNYMVSPLGALFRGKSREQVMYDGLRNKFPQYGEDAIRYAIAQALQDPQILTDGEAWARRVPNR
jgi:hypothetical protein